MAGLRPCTRYLFLSPRQTRHLLALATPTGSRLTPIPPQLPSANQMLRGMHRPSADMPEMEDPVPSAKAKANGRRLQVLTGGVTALIGALYILYKQLSAKEMKEKEPEDEQVGPVVAVVM